MCLLLLTPVEEAWIRWVGQAWLAYLAEKLSTSFSVYPETYSICLLTEMPKTKLIITYGIYLWNVLIAIIMILNA